MIMGQFKPMVKMETTEPSVILKLKKGGHVMSKDVAKVEDDYKPMGKANGGMMEMLSKAKGPLISAAKQAMSKGMGSPKKPSIASRMKSMKANQPGAMMGMARKAAQSMAGKAPMQASPMKSQGLMRGAMGMAKKAAMANRPAAPMSDEMPAMKHGGESKSAHASEMKKMSGLSKELKSHAGKPASKAHKGLKTGGVVNGQGGFKTGGVIKGNGGGYAKGGATKKFADGGAVQDDGRAVKMPQGNKRPSSPVSINRLSGTFKKGGKVGCYAEGGDAQTEKNQRGYKQYEEEDRKFNESLREDVMSGLTYPFRKFKEMFSDKPAPKGSVTKTKESVTIAKKSGGKC
jgi:hypothetical protein